MKRKSKINTIDILAMIICILIATIMVIYSLYGQGHLCGYCKKPINKQMDDYVVCDGRIYYHSECYQEKLKEEKRNEIS